MVKAADSAAQSADTDVELFDWSTEWYPVAPVRDLDKEKPNRLTLLGKDFCVWFQPETGGTWQAFDDSCPHRRVPLSEGRIEAGGGAGRNGSVLQCAYHGWEFDKDGACVKIPQLDSAFTPGASACATAYPTQVVQDLLWIFPTHDNPELASQKSPATIPQLDDGDKVDATALFVRDLPYSWEALVENLCDPTHVVFAHHGCMRGADRYGPDTDKQVNLRVTSMSRTGFVADKDPAPANGKYQVRFQPPCLLYYDIMNSRAMGSSLRPEQKSKVYLGLGNYCIPTGPASSRLIARFPFYLPVKPVMFMMKYTPRWITHFAQNLVIDSDVVFLAAQDERLRQEAAQAKHKSPLSQYYLPARSDAMVVAFRKWLQAFGSPAWIGIPAARSDGDGGLGSWEGVPERHGRDALLDRYRQHTEICSSCRTAHRWLKRSSRILTGGAVLALAIASSGLIDTPKRWVLSGLSLMLFALPQIALQPLVRRLECVPWPRPLWLRSPTAAAKKEKVIGA
jgi:phenylpropionate dioxygenase-like ring-hydroxylating dioxygenase large terminal subunit